MTSRLLSKAAHVAGERYLQQGCVYRLFGGLLMQVVLYDWHGREWAFLRAEGLQELAVEEQTRDIFRRLEAELNRLDLSLANTVRTRLWASDRASRDRGSAVRAATLIGQARSASSSFIAPDWFESDAAVGVELWAMRQTSSAAKTSVEYEPPIVPVRYVACDSVVELSGVTAVLPTLENQTRDILQRIGETLALAGATWQDAVQISCVLHRSQSLRELRSLLSESAVGHAAAFGFLFADGYSSEGKLVEIEVTAQVQNRP
jgi:enamine deaminase RidA (YjgF/YER057c/UK114 family)